MNLLAQILVSRHVDGLRYLQAPVPAPGDEPRVISIGQSGKLGPCVWTHCRIFGSSKTCHLSFPWSRLETASAPLAGRPFGVCAPRERDADKEEKLSDLFPIQFPRIKVSQSLAEELWALSSRASFGASEKLKRGSRSAGTQRTTKTGSLLLVWQGHPIPFRKLRDDRTFDVGKCVCGSHPVLGDVERA